MFEFLKKAFNPKVPEGRQVTDGEMFLDHSILVSGNIVDGPTNADIPG